MRPKLSASLRAALAAVLTFVPPAQAITQTQARSLDFSSIFSPAQSIMIRALNSDRAFLDAFYPEFAKAKEDEAAGRTAAVQAFAEKWRGTIRQRAQELLSADPSDRARFPPTSHLGLELALRDVLYMEEDVKAHTRDVPPRTLSSPQGDALRDVEITLRNRVAIRRFLGFVVGQPGGALGSADRDWAAVREAMTQANQPGSLDDVRGWLASTAPAGTPAAPTPEPKKEDFVRVFGAQNGESMYQRFRAELAALARTAPDFEARRRRLVEEWQGRLNKGPLEARVGLVFSSPAERALALFLAKAWDGKSGDEAEAAFSAVLDKALAGDAAARRSIVDASRQAAAANLKDEAQPAGLKGFLASKSVARDSLVAFYCSTAPEAPAAPASGTSAARPAAELARDRDAAGRTGSEGQSRAADFANREAGGPTVSAAPPPSGIDPALAEECSRWNSAEAARRAQAAEPPPGSLRTPTVPNIANAGAVTPDKEKDDSAAKAAAKKKVDLQRAVIGGMGGALVLGVFGFIFGGPIGALAMGAIGFGVMAGVSYMNNNPIGG